MASCDSNRTSAYSEDIRWRVIYQYYFLQGNIALNLNIDKSTVYRTIALFDKTGCVKKAEYPKGQNHHLQKLTEIDQFLIMEVVLNQPGIYLHEIQEFIYQETGTSVSLPTICKFLHKQGFTLQKMARIFIGRNYDLRMKFWEDVSIFP